jgi:hypothetical protein
LQKKPKQAGQAVLEYVMLLGITVGTMLYFVRTMNKTFDKTVPKWGGRLERQLRAGAAPAKVWDN